MLTLITGTPGAFKTTYAVWELARQIPGTFIDGPDGKPIERKLFSNINGLLVEHEHITSENLENWHEWAKPGNVILFDEVQHVWRPRGLGSKVPPEIAALETHRHMGVDIIVVTQHPMLIDPNIRRLVNRHLHLRRLANGASWVYEWDHCSNPHQTKSAMESKVWFRKKAAFDLFTSAQAHTKTTARIPRIAYLLIPCLIGFAYLGHGFYKRISDGLDPTASPLASKVDPPSLLAPGGDLQPSPGLPTTPGRLPVDPLGIPPPESASSAPSASRTPAEQFAGCALVKTVCSCYMGDGSKADKPQEYCLESTLPNPVRLGEVLPARDIAAGYDVTAPARQGGEDAAFFKFVYRDRSRASIDMW